MTKGADKYFLDGMHPTTKRRESPPRSSLARSEHQCGPPA